MTKADQQAAERLLKAAVKRAIDMLRVVDQPVRYVLGADFDGPINYRYSQVWQIPNEPDPVVAMLRAAGESAALLLGEAS